MCSRMGRSVDVESSHPSITRVWLAVVQFENSSWHRATARYQEDPQTNWCGREDSNFHGLPRYHLKVRGGNALIDFTGVLATCLCAVVSTKGEHAM
jgi:hypothetical protein